MLLSRRGFLRRLYAELFRQKSAKGIIGMLPIVLWTIAHKVEHLVNDKAQQHGDDRKRHPIVQHKAHKPGFRYDLPI